MENIQKYGVAIAGIVLSVLFSVVVVTSIKSSNSDSNSSVSNGQIKKVPGEYKQSADYFAQGFYAGLTNQFVMDGQGNITRSPDGFITWASFVMSTGTAKTVFTNTGDPMMCQDEAGDLLFRSTAFTPGMVVVLGTTTASNLYSANLLASTTIATTTVSGTQIVDVTYSAPFLLGTNESITATISDTDKVVASSTYFANRTGEFGFACRTAGQ